MAMPRIGVSMSLYDTVIGKTVAWDSGVKSNFKTCYRDDRFTGLVSGRNHTIYATGYIDPPAGYVGGPLNISTNKRTK